MPPSWFAVTEVFPKQTSKSALLNALFEGAIKADKESQHQMCRPSFFSYVDI